MEIILFEVTQVDIDTKCQKQKTRWKKTKKSAAENPQCLKQTDTTPKNLRQTTENLIEIKKKKTEWIKKNDKLKEEKK